MKSTFRIQTRSTLGTVAGAFVAIIALAATGCSSEGIDRADATATDATSTDFDAVAASPSRVERTSSSVEPSDTFSDESADEVASTEQAQTAPRGDYEASEPSNVAKPPAPSPAHSPSPSVDFESTNEPSDPSPEPVVSNTLRVVGNQLLDTCGQPFVIRGVEQILGNQLPEGNDWLGLVREIAATGSNAVRILPGVNTLTTENIDEILTFIGSQGMIAFVDPLNSDDDWYAREDVKAMLKKHESFIIIDAYGEPQYDDLVKWRTEAKEALVHMRALGYTVPFTVYANQFGRGLPSLFDYGQEILDADPLHNSYLGWQAYWGNNGYYQETYGYTLTEAVQAIVDSGLPIQLGLDHITDMPSTEADYGTLMQAAEANGVGWLWWDFYNPYGAENNLTVDGSLGNLTATGRDVLESHPASIANTAKLACRR